MIRLKTEQEDKFNQVSVLLTHIHPTNKDEFEMALAYLLDQKLRIKPHSVPFYKTQSSPAITNITELDFLSMHLIFFFLQLLQT
jgi:hypothetical protein